MDDALAGPPNWTKANPAGTPPSVRYGASAIYDAPRDRLLVFGGDSQSADNALYELSLAGTMAWSPLTTSGSAPITRTYAAAVYDPVRDRMLMFGGQLYPTFLALNEVWELSLSGTPAWSQILPPGLYPNPRDDPAMIYDPVRDRLLIYGGFANDQETWALNLAPSPMWEHLSPSGQLPSARTGARAIYDGLNDRMLMYGGMSGSSRCRTPSRGNRSTSGVHPRPHR